MLFFKACREPCNEMAVENFKRHDTLITKTIILTGRVEAYVLPKTVKKWPTFVVSKQESAGCPEIYFKRIGDTNGPRYEETVNLLLKGEQVISTGLSGVGKSAEVSGLLMDFLRHMGEKGWPKEVWFYRDKKMLVYSIVNGNPHVAIKKQMNLDKVAARTDDFSFKEKIDEKPVLIMELNENENHPRSHIPTYIPLSNREVYDTTKEIKKAGGRYMLVDPPKCEDIQSMAVFEAAFGSKSVFKGMTDIAAAQLVKDRFDIVGPRLREILANSDKFKGTCDALDANTSILFSDLSKVYLESIPNGVNQYVGVFLIPGNFIPCLGYPPNGDMYFIRFLSGYIAQLIARACSIENKQVLERERFNYLIPEEIMCHGLMNPLVYRSLHHCFEYENWKFYDNDNLNLPISNPEFPFCDKKNDFPSIYLDKNVSELEERTLYRSSLDDGALYDALLVSHSEHRVYVFQTTNWKLGKKKLSYSTLNKVMAGLQFDENSEYKLVWVYCSDRTAKFPTEGRSIQNHGKINEDVIKNIERRLDKVLIARVCYYPNLEKMSIS